MIRYRIGWLSLGIAVLAAVASPRSGAQVAAPPAARVQDPRMGTNRPTDDYEKTLPMIAQAGLTWVRDGVSWGIEVEKVKGDYTIPEKDLRRIKAIHQNKLKVLFLLNSYGNRAYDDPYDPEAYTRFAVEMARQLKDDVDCMEILNEPANFGFSKAYGGTWNGLEKDGSVSPWVGRYVSLLNKVAPAIKAVAPNMKVIGLGSVAPVNFRQLAMGINPAVDGIVDHPYSFKTVPEIVPFSAGMVQRDGIAVADEQGTFASLIANYRAQSRKYNGPKEIWLTEWGYSTFQPTLPVMYAGFTPSAQAKYMLRRFVEGIGLGVEVSIQYDFVNDYGGANPHDAENNFGLVDGELKPKPAYEAISRLTQVTANLRPDASVKVNVFPAADRPDVWPIVWDKGKLAAPGTIPTYGFRDAEGRLVVAIWSAERADGDLQPRVADIELLIDRPVTKIHCFDVMSGKRRKVAFKQEEGCVMMETQSIPDSPIFLTVE
ncbi:MAG: hypothetical protein WC789_05130 [Lentisphaeria bacterium]|jgi:hypothetical protein